MIEKALLGLEELDKTQVALAGGKGANLGELSRIDGIRVPAGFCVTTDAFRRIVAAAPTVEAALDRASLLSIEDREAVRAFSAEVRRAIEALALPDDLATAITGALVRLGDGSGYAGDPAPHPGLLGLALHRASRDLPDAQRHRTPEGGDGRRRSTDGSGRRG